MFKATGINRRLILFFIIGLSIAGCDQITKFQATACIGKPSKSSSGVLASNLIRQFNGGNAPERNARAVVVKDYWDLRYVENPGAAWSSFRKAPASFRRGFLLAVSAVAMTFLIFYFRKVSPNSLQIIALPLIFGGALGNFLDRARMGYVVDFIVWHWSDKFSWPVFNIADVAIVMGVTVFLLDMFRTRAALIQS